VRTALIEGEEERAWQVWQKKFGSASHSPESRVKQMRFLQQRGFSHAAIQSTMKRAARVGEQD
jgi:regulatory protein